MYGTARVTPIEHAKTVFGGRMRDKNEPDPVSGSFLGFYDINVFYYALFPKNKRTDVRLFRSIFASFAEYCIYH